MNIKYTFQLEKKVILDFFFIIALWILFLKCLMDLCESFYISLRLTFSFYLLVDADLTDLEG